MATVRSGHQTVGTARVQIDGLHTQWSHIHIRNDDTTKTLYIGGPDVTSSDTVNVSWMRIDY